jgi:acetylornithine deacetylase/succinyl-diaminopimelate desuccinylase-like protein
MPVTTRSASSELEGYLHGTKDRRMAWYEAFLRIPSISTLSEHQPDCRRAAAFIADQLQSIGIEHVDVTETGKAGHPVVYGDWLHAEGSPTALVYGHYDVQPVDPLDLWISPPFEPSVHDGRMHARGASDDKGHLQMHIRAVEALMATRGSLPLNLRFVFEGDEESNAEYLEAWLGAHRDRLAADVAIISDTTFFEDNVPAITIGLRGIMEARIDVIGTPVDVHSGSYGGAIPNPINALATIIAGLKDTDGRILVEGYYEEVVPLSDADRAAFAHVPFDEEEFRKRIGARALFGERGYTTLERKGARPTLDVTGIWGGYQGEGTKTIIPAHAHAKVSCRLVVDQQPDRTFERFRDHVLRIAPTGVEVVVNYVGGGRPSLTPMDHPATQAAARAIERAFGRAPVYQRDGGSVPVCSSFEEQLGLPVVLAGFSNPDDNAHAPNESMVLDNFERGIRAIAYLWDELAD